jgi:hypothetical protein
VLRLVAGRSGGALAGMPAAGGRISEIESGRDHARSPGATSPCERISCVVRSDKPTATHSSPARKPEAPNAQDEAGLAGRDGDRRACACSLT